MSDSISTEITARDLRELVRKELRDLPSYVPAPGAGKSGERIIRLDMNESPYGPSPRTRAAMMDFVQTNRYPDFGQAALRAALANYTGFPVDQIVCGAGLDDVFTTLALTLIEPGDNVIISEPTFGVYRPLFSLHGARVENVPLSGAFDLRPDRVLAAIDERTKIVVICSPNNPTGNPLSNDAIHRICAGAPCLVALDEAYVEFSGRTHLPLMAEFPNVMILRTMSKWAGLAGMRVGYGLMPKQLVDAVNHAAPPFHNVSLMSSEAAIASLQDREFLLRQVDRICADRDALYDRLRVIPGCEPLPSVTNFILVKTQLADARPLVAEIARRGVLIRGYGDPVIQNCFRVTVGLPEENEQFLVALEQSLEELNA